MTPKRLRLLGILAAASLAAPACRSAEPQPRRNRPPAARAAESKSVGAEARQDDKPAAANQGRTYYVSPDGKEENDGSREKPWPNVHTALAKGKGGNTVVLLPGIYRGPVTVPKAFGGAEGTPTVLKSDQKWKAIILGAPEHTIVSDAEWVVVDGFEVMGARADGVKLNGANNVVRNCWIHNNAHMGVAMHGVKDSVIENNLIEFNGIHVQFHHGVYADGDGLKIRGNVVRHNAGYGLHLYPGIRDAVIENNVVTGHASHAGVIIAAPEGGGRNHFVNNTVADNRDGLEVWNADGEVIANNILIAPKGEPIAYRFKTGTNREDYNLVSPALASAGPHDLKGDDPMFVEAAKGVYWLRPASPVIGKGSAALAPASDFWGRRRAADRAPDLGAFAFTPSLAAPEARRGWRGNWAYVFSAQGNTPPDFWAALNPPVGGGER